LRIYVLDNPEYLLWMRCWWWWWDDPPSPRWSLRALSVRDTVRKTAHEKADVRKSFQHSGFWPGGSVARHYTKELAFIMVNR
jgi:hypothetical protein